MRAVNLLPEELRRAGGAGRSGGAAYVVLGVLALLVVLVAVHVLAGKTVDDRRAQLDRTNAEATEAETRAAAFAPIQTFVTASRERADTVAAVAKGRFDWAYQLREISRLVPAGTWVTNITGTTSATVALEGGGGNTLRAALPSPAVELVGCTSDQADVARLMANLRAMDRVQRVALATSEKSESSSAATTPGGGDASSGDCRRTSEIPQFAIVVFFETPEGAIIPGAPTTAPDAAAAGSGAPAQTTDGSGAAPAQPGEATAGAAQ